MAVTKTIEVDGKEVQFRASAAIPRLYRNKSKTDRETKEVRAESCAYCVCSALGLDTSDYSFGYIAGYSSGKNMKELKSVMQDIKNTADKILSAIMPADNSRIAVRASA